MKDVYDKGHREVSNEFFGPFPVLRLVGPVAYQLQLPAMAKLHDVFHVSLLKPHTGSSPTSTLFLPLVDNGDVFLTPAAVLRARLINDQWGILIQWMDTEPKAATWEHVDIFKQVYPTFELEDNLFLQGEADVVDSMAH
ncbi:uncharacterized protein [Aristolochia californica]|uniref:uncharacterized protein n=1 Tax=Aristolochia californica TaxID=171875 RepID=UPI0035DF897D